MAVYDALELRLIGEDRVEYVRAREDVPIETELEHFLSRTDIYETGWVLVEGGRFIRYDRVASVSMVRGLDDERPMVALG
jgi:hypothetical protein